jgi:hypothetical protein
MFREKEKKYQFVDRTANKTSEEKATQEYRLRMLEMLGNISNELAKQTEILKELKSVRGK